jgi:penicillin amidase
MHLAADLPSEWDSYETWGASMPGLPCIQLGQNRWIAWGITAALCDDVELYRERIHRIEKDRYLAGHEWRQFAARRELIGVRGGKIIERIVRSSRHGPVISDFTGIDNSREVLALRWCATEASQESHSIYRLNHARNWREFVSALSYHSAPSLNFVYADRDGNIGYALAGKIPARNKAASLLPLAGWDDANDWRGYIPFEQMPQLYNPPAGYIATANNKIVDAAYPYYLSNFFEPPHRVRRIEELLRSQDRFNAAEMAQFQLDQLSLHAVELLETLGTDLRAISHDDNSIDYVVARLLAWDGNCAPSSVPAAIFHAFHQRLLKNLLSEELGDELCCAYTEILNQCIVPTDNILRDESSSWFARRPRRALVAQSLREACAELRQIFGNDCERWQWGELHRLSINHALDRLTLLKPIISLGPVAAGGDGMTVNFGFYRHSNPFAQTVGAALRFVIDFNDLQNSGYVLASGQSGHPGSPHYRDQYDHWRNSDKIRLDSDPTELSDSRRSLFKPA